MVNYPRATYRYRKALKLNQLQKDIVVGSLLGSSTMETSRNFLCSVKFEQRFKNRVYTSHLYNTLKEWCYTEPHLHLETNRCKYSRTSYYFQTFKHFAYFRYYNGFYEFGDKIVPLFIHRWVTPRALAYWFMDSGERHQNSYMFHLHHFSNLQDHKMLIDLLKHMFWIDAEIYIDANKGWYKLRLSDESAPKFISIIKPYVIPCMYYKI